MIIKGFHTFDNDRTCHQQDAETDARTDFSNFGESQLRDHESELFHEIRGKMEGQKKGKKAKKPQRKKKSVRKGEGI